MSSLLLGAENKEEGGKHQDESQEVEGHRDFGLERHFVDTLALKKLDKVLAVHDRHLVVETVPGERLFFVFLHERKQGILECFGEGAYDAVAETCCTNQIAGTCRVENFVNGNLNVCREVRCLVLENL